MSGVATPVRFPGAELTLALLLAAAASILAIRPRRRAVAVIIAIPLLFTALIAGASLFRPIFIARVFCWLGMPLSLVIADAIATPSLVRPVLLAAVLLNGAIALGYQFVAAKKEPWRGLLHRIGPDLAHADQVILAPLTDPTAFAYSAPEVTHLETWHVGFHGSVENDEMPRRMGLRTIPLAEIVDDVRSGQRVELSLRTPDLASVNPLLALLPPPRVDIERSSCVSLQWHGNRRHPVAPPGMSLGSWCCE